jgi:nitroreductase
MDKAAVTEAPISDLIRRRWSPRAFDSRAVEPEKLRSVFEAARWAASSNNLQPWSYIVATRSDAENFARVLQCFNENNQIWTRHAPVVALSVAQMNNPTNGKPNRFAFHDVGQASAYLALEASYLGLEIHQMGGISPEKGREIFAVPADHEVVAGIALGYPGHPDSLPENLRERELQPRKRKRVSEFVFSGQWGQTADFLPPKE